jgi:hypothetical protein
VDQSLLHRLANTCKDYYVIRTIDDLFIYAGAKPEWWTQPAPESYSSQRIARFYGWVAGINANAPRQFATVITGVIRSILGNSQVPENERNAVAGAAQQLKAKESGEGGIQLEPLLATLVRVLAKDGLAREVAVVTSAEARLEYRSGDRWNDVDTYGILLCVPLGVFEQVEDDLGAVQKKILEKIRVLTRGIRGEAVSDVEIVPRPLVDSDWRSKALAWLTGQNVTNQGRIRSDNVASRLCDGLQFRSEPEINLYKALKAIGVSFAPLPVFVRGGDEYRRIEPDFVVIRDGVVLVVEVDGDTFHRESPAEAYSRTMMLENEGARIVHVQATECDTPERATAYAKKVLQTIAKLKASSR